MVICVELHPSTSDIAPPFRSREALSPKASFPRKREPMATEQAMARCPGTHRRERRWDPAWAPAGACPRESGGGCDEQHEGKKSHQREFAEPPLHVAGELH
jgi:hypothetical protein